MIDVTSFKMKDLAEVEKLSGLSMSEWENPTVALTMAIAYVGEKKNNPKLTWEDVENMSMEDLQALTDTSELPKANIS